MSLVVSIQKPQGFQVLGPADTTTFFFFCFLRNVLFCFLHCFVLNQPFSFFFFFSLLPTSSISALLQKRQTKREYKKKRGSRWYASYLKIHLDVGEKTCDLALWETSNLAHSSISKCHWFSRSWTLKRWSTSKKSLGQYVKSVAEQVTLRAAWKTITIANKRKYSNLFCQVVISWRWRGGGVYSGCGHHHYAIVRRCRIFNNDEGKGKT